MLVIGVALSFWARCTGSGMRLGSGGDALLATVGVACCPPSLLLPAAQRLLSLSSVPATRSWSMTLVGLAALPFLVAAYMVAAAQAFGHFDSVSALRGWCRAAVPMVAVRFMRMLLRADSMHCPEGHSPAPRPACLPAALQNSEGAAAANQVATEAVSAIKVVTAYSLQPQVAELYHAAAAEGGGSRSAHFSGLAFGVAQARARRLHSPCSECRGRRVHRLGARCSSGTHIPRVARGLPHLRAAHPVPVLLPHVLVWRHPDPGRQHHVLADEQGAPPLHEMRSHPTLLCCPCCCSTCTAPTTHEPALVTPCRATTFCCTWPWAWPPRARGCAASVAPAAAGAAGARVPAGRRLLAEGGMMCSRGGQAAV